MEKPALENGQLTKSQILKTKSLFRIQGYLSKHNGCDRGERRWLVNERVAASQGRRHLPGAGLKWIIPGADPANNSQWFLGHVCE